MLTAYRLRSVATGLLGIMITAGTLLPQASRAHCDSMDGPVIIEAQMALEKHDITPLLKWVKPEYEAEVRTAFAKTEAVRGKGADAKDLADTYFFETLVRVHRAGENAPYTGIKPAGQQEAVIIAADRALDNGSPADLEQDLLAAVKTGIEQRFEHARETKAHAAHNVEAGRTFVAAYVEYMHFIERLHLTATGAAHETEETEAAAAPSCGHK